MIIYIHKGFNIRIVDGIFFVISSRIIFPERIIEHDKVLVINLVAIKCDFAILFFIT